MSEIPDLEIIPKFVCAGDELEKITRPEGCEINIARDSTISICDDSLSDDDEEYLASEFQNQYLDPKTKEEKSKRDFISISLNTNRDVTSVKSKLANIIGDEDDYICTRQSSDTSMNDYLEIHKRYNKLGNFEELLSKPSQFEDIAKAQVYKHVLMAGTGPRVELDTIVIYNLALWAEGVKEPFDSTWLRKTTIVSDLDQDSILPGIGELLLSCRKGELCEGIIRPKAAFGALGVKPRIPANANIFCLLEIVKVIKKDKISKLTFNREQAREEGFSFEDFWETADEARKRGNYFFTEKQYRFAIQRYKAGINIMETLTYNNSEEEKKGKDLLFKLYIDIARAANESGEPRYALYACKQADLIYPNQSKTFWHQLKAWKLRGHNDRALYIAERAMRILKLDPSSLKYFQQAARDLQEIIKNDEADLNKMYRLMGRSVCG